MRRLLLIALAAIATLTLITLGALTSLLLQFLTLFAHLDRLAGR